MAHRGFTDSQIEAFMWIMKTSSATEAADKMLISQPAISRLIKQLEARLGFELFERHNNRLLPTRRGTLFYDEVDRVYLGLNHLRQFADRLREQATGQLRVVSMPSFAMSLVPEAAAQLAQQFPDLEISLYSYRSNQIPEDMVAQRFDFGITTDTRLDPRYQSFQHSLPGVCLIPADHPLAAKSVIEISDFENETLICGEPAEQSRNLITQHLTDQQVTPKKIWTVSLSEMAIRLVANGTGVSIVNTVSACDAKRAGVVVRPLGFDIHYDFQIILPLAKNVEPALNELNGELITLIEKKIHTSLNVFA
ncbi:LysR family transcriptional regulator [Vibrio fluvialis]|uniref:LysR substrate-binding domain-containing protein n=1 Tax=Vibrio fluvialis TaxID=676 RepID=UPI0005C80E07|nr:LysR substrate-binding domain-containing protein [Vibrio fluvialis]EKO3497560.1 LysR family transcriptional regulator [Vibrio fluvialis]EKO3992002.1 LysR family transcriptional regulator [Vibrio fluvialis]MBL4279755.1 LysR family transcriptional regulator [Vibrio fluvialis]